MRISAIAILVILFLWPAAVFGQSPELMDAYNRANELSDEGRYQEAIPFAKEALSLTACVIWKPSSRHSRSTFL